MQRQEDYGSDGINTFAQKAFEMAFGHLPDNHAHHTLLAFVANVKTVAYQAKLRNTKIDLKSDRRIADSGLDAPLITDAQYNDSKAAVLALTRSMRRAAPSLYPEKVDKAMTGVIDRLERDVFRMASREAKLVKKEEGFAVAVQQAAEKSGLSKIR